MPMPENFIKKMATDPAASPAVAQVGGIAPPPFPPKPMHKKHHKKHESKSGGRNANPRGGAKPY